MQPFHNLAESILSQSTIRSIITTSSRSSETKVIPMLLEQARFSEIIENKINQLTYNLSKELRERQRTKKCTNDIVQRLLQEFSLSSQEGLSLMCLAEALLRIPDKTTRDLLIQDKIIKGNWKSHLSNSNCKLINIFIWMLLFTKRLISSPDKDNVSSLKSMSQFVRKQSKPLIRKSFNLAINLMGKQFIIGENITSALVNAQKLENNGFRYSYDILGEAALTSEDANSYLSAYQQAIHLIGKGANKKGIYEGPGISIKLSALHPRYNRMQYERVMEELYPALKSLTLLAQYYDIGITIDAEEADRLELSLDLLERLCSEAELKGWNGIGFAIQAYQKRCPFVIDFLAELAQRTNRRLMIRLVKGAYWDSEIKRTQVEGLQDYPVYTRKIYTDISYLACARKLLNLSNLIYPQFATHNAHTLAAIYHLAGSNYYSGQYEFQCLHGMGESLYKQVVGKVTEHNFNRVCRIYAPVGAYKTLLAYLVRRILENGANNSFVNRIADKTLSIEELVSSPINKIDSISRKEGTIGLSNPKIPLPRNIYGKQRVNSVGIDLVNEHNLQKLSNSLLKIVNQIWHAEPIIKGELDNNGNGISRSIINPAQSNDIVGSVREATEKEVSQALDTAMQYGHIWSNVLPKERASILECAAKDMEHQMTQLICLLVREAGKTYNNAIAEIREAIDFLYYYASIIRNDFNNETYLPLGTVVCISPWNFPLAIFIGQISAALATGNSVLAKPAEQTPLIAAQAVKILLNAGIPNGVLQLLPGLGETIGTQLTCDKRVNGIMFTGSTTVAKIIQRRLTHRFDLYGKPIPLIAETGGINSMIVDSSALTEQVVIDVITSAFDSAGQRCSSLRLLCIQEDVADYTLKMLRQTMMEYRMGNPERLCIDIGPVINREAKNNIELYIQSMRNKGFKIHQVIRENLKDCQEWDSGTFVKPTLIELDKISNLKQEVFGPVLHIVRFQSKSLLKLIDQINASGYGLTFGLHTRIDKRISQVTKKAAVGNIYVNRNMIGAVVGTQPFGGEGLSGTGPKAGGPLYLFRLLSNCPENASYISLSRQDIECSIVSNIKLRTNLLTKHQILKYWAQNKPKLLSLCRHYEKLTQTGTIRVLPGPTGEKNTFTLLPRKLVLCVADNEEDIFIQLAAVISVGSKVLWQDDEMHRSIKNTLPDEIQKSIVLMKNILSIKFDAVIFHGNSDQLHILCEQIASQEHFEIIIVQSFSYGETNILLDRLLIERSLSVNTTAAGGNTTLMMMG